MTDTRASGTVDDGQPAGTSAPVRVGAVATAAAPSVVDEGDAAVLSTTLRKVLRVVLADANGDLDVAAENVINDLTAPQPGDVQRLSAALDTSVANGVVLTVGRLYELRAATDCRFRFGGTTPTAVTTDPFLLAGQAFQWRVSAADDFVAVINELVAVEAHVYPVSGE